ncbi:Phosphoribosylglycinamide synthetase, N-domain protein (plasmid) [Allomeiothermus silvanus DSM 9946]|uniref:Phosphoribosylglycinamide synthetase, N-domain protein n=1 Tax=Allomeiothermus silvanus (strain ATCC 700542 / DSM 9946 / NBRC 106475 / NCIMB 13440 / VI-R2) TaxID=526227 RepID=D7BJ00_ALLS1|nr:hypothetical protein [Allomeiothermus silvanus]ADH65156.1 Phosphoribosylglycinamide synthetase, N-domain protein [Allomeiothermus silvanus DSM 9946]
MRKRVYLAAALLLGLLGACSGGSRPQGPEPAPRGTPTGDPAVATIGPEGGRLASADGVLTLEVPPGAVEAPTQFGIQPITNTAGGLASGYRLSPEGRTFPKPVKLTFRYTEEELGEASPEGLGLAFQDEKGVWWAHLGTELDKAGRTLSVQTRHFSDWVRKTFWVFIPEEARLKVGESLGLMVIACVLEQYAGPVPEFDEEELLAPLIPKDRESCGPSVRTGSWAVNGVPGGNGTYGTVIPLQPSSRATYTAPAKVPSPNPVTVTADMTWEERKVTKRFTSRITVQDALVQVHVVGSFSYVGHPIAVGVIADVQDRFEADLGLSTEPGGSGSYMDNIQNTLSTEANARPEAGLEQGICSFQLGGDYEHLSVSSWRFMGATDKLYYFTLEGSVTVPPVTLYLRTDKGCLASTFPGYSWDRGGTAFAVDLSCLQKPGDAYTATDVFNSGWEFRFERR